MLYTQRKGILPLDFPCSFEINLIYLFYQQMSVLPTEYLFYCHTLTSGKTLDILDGKYCTHD